jgi:hypothetical protein
MRLEYLWIYLMQSKQLTYYVVGPFQVSSFMKLSFFSFVPDFSNSGYCLAQTQMLLFLNYRNIDANLIKESKSLSERFKNRHRSLEDYITEVCVFFAALVEK